MTYDNIGDSSEATEELRKPEEWMAKFGDKIMDHDGWRAGVPGYPGGKHWDVPISRKEYEARFALCTARRTHES